MSILLAFQWTSTTTLAVLVALFLFVALLIPFLVKEIRDGKRDLGPLRRLMRGGRVILGPETPSGAGENRPGTVADPAPGQPDAQGYSR